MREHITRLAKHSLTYGVGNFLSKSLIILLMSFYTRLLSPGDYGLIETIRVLMGGLAIIYFIGLEGAAGRFYFDFSANERERERYLGSILISLLAVSLLLATILHLLGAPFFKKISPEVDFQYIRFGIWTAFLLTPFYYLLAVLRAREDSKFYIFFQTIQMLALLGGSIILLVIFKKGVLGKLEGDLLASVLIFLLSLAFLFQKRIARISFLPHPTWESIKFGLPLIPHLLSAWILHLGGRLILQHFRPMSEVGLFSVAHNFGMIMQMILVSINNAWAPFLFDTATNNVGAKSIISKLTTYYIMSIAGIGLLISVSAPLLFHLFTTNEYLQAVSLVPIIVLAYLVYGLYMMFANQIFYVKKTGFLPLITMSVAALSIALNIGLIPLWGITGTALSLLLSCTAFASITYIVSSRLYPISYEWRKIELIFLAAIGTFALTNFIHLENVWGETFLRIASTSLYPFLLFKMKILTENETHYLKEVYLRIKMGCFSLFKKQEAPQ